MKLETHLKHIHKKISETHWTKKAYHYRDENGKELYCLVGHVNKELKLPANLMSHGWMDFKSTPEEAQRTKIFELIQIGMKKVTPRAGCGHIESWNDSRVRTREQVLQALEFAIEEARNER